MTCCAVHRPGKVSLEIPNQTVAQATLAVWLAVGHTGTIWLRHLVQCSEFRSPSGTVCGEARAGVSATFGEISSSLTLPMMGLPKPFRVGELGYKKRKAIKLEERGNLRGMGTLPLQLPREPTATQGRRQGSADCVGTCKNG